MRIQRKRDYAIVTGDVVGSSRLTKDARKRLHAALATSARKTAKAFKDAVPVPVDLFRGDSWQMLVRDPVQALRIGLFLRATLRASSRDRKFDTRFVLAVGRIDFLPGESVSEGDGEAYRLSGKGLEELPRRERMRLEYPGHADEAALATVVHLMDGFVSRWSDRQALAACGALRGWNQETIARRNWTDPISQQAVAQHLRGASWAHVERGLEFYEARVGNSENNGKRL